MLTIHFINKKVKGKTIKSNKLYNILFYKGGWITLLIACFLWFYISAAYTLFVGYFLWGVNENDIYLKNEYIYLWILLLFSGWITIKVFFSNLAKNWRLKQLSIKQREQEKKQREQEKKQQEIKEAEYKSKQRFRELLQIDFERRQKELEKIKNTLELYSKEYNIDNLTIQRMYKMLEAWQGESIDPFNSLYASIFRKQEFKSLYDLGLIRQDSHFPYLFTFEKVKDIPLILPNVEYVKDRNIILPEMNMLDNLSDGFEFEQYIAVLLEKNGYSKIEVLPMSGDYGVDILAEKSEVKYAFQCKYYSQPVGISAVQEVSSGKTHYNAHVGVVVTNNYFTSNALQLAETNGILMWDRDKILKMTIK